MDEADLLVTAAQLESATKGRIKATDPYVVEALWAATDSIRSECGWHVGPVRSETLTLDGSGGTILLVPSLHVTAITSVTENGTLLTVDTDFDWSVNGVLERLSGMWAGKRRSIVVALTHGFAPATIPGVVNLGVTLAARTVMAKRAAGAVREQAGQNNIELGKIGGFVSIPADAVVLEHEKPVLRRYTIPGSA